MLCDPSPLATFSSCSLCHCFFVTWISIPRPTACSLDKPRLQLRQVQRPTPQQWSTGEDFMYKHVIHLRNMLQYVPSGTTKTRASHSTYHTCHTKHTKTNKACSALLALSPFPSPSLLFLFPKPTSQPVEAMWRRGAVDPVDPAGQAHTTHHTPHPRPHAL